MGRSVDEATGGGHKQIWKTERKKTRYMGVVSFAKSHQQHSHVNIYARAE